MVGFSAAPMAQSRVTLPGTLIVESDLTYLAEEREWKTTFHCQQAARVLLSFTGAAMLQTVVAPSTRVSEQGGG